MKADASQTVNLEGFFCSKAYDLVNSLSELNVDVYVNITFQTLNIQLYL